MPVIRSRLDLVIGSLSILMLIFSAACGGKPGEAQDPSAADGAQGPTSTMAPSRNPTQAAPKPSPSPTVSTSTIALKGAEDAELCAETRPDWSPDGTHIVFQSNCGGVFDIYVMNADGSNLTSLTADLSAWILSHMFIIDRTGNKRPTWSPDGTQILFSSGRSNGMVSYVDYDLYTMDADGSNVVQLVEESGVDGEADWSPDGTTIVFASDRAGGVNIYLVGADGSNPRPITELTSDNDLPSWSPDGTRILFVSDREGDDNIYVMDADGSNVVRLTVHPVGDTYPAWSPDGRQIAFTSDRNGNAEIYSIASDGTGLIRLTNDPAYDSAPAWAPWGDRIAFASDRDGDLDIYVMNLDGSDLVQLTGGPDFLMESDSWEVNYLRGLRRLYLGEMEAAIEAFDRAVQIDPENGEAYAARGIANWFAGQPEMGIMDMKRALELGVDPSLDGLLTLMLEDLGV